jgi:hypothetical protein
MTISNDHKLKRAILADVAREPSISANQIGATTDPLGAISPFRKN